MGDEEGTPVFWCEGEVRIPFRFATTPNAWPDDEALIVQELKEWCLDPVSWARKSVVLDPGSLSPESIAREIVAYLRTRGKDGQGVGR